MVMHFSTVLPIGSIAQAMEPEALNPLPETVTSAVYADPVPLLANDEVRFDFGPGEVASGYMKVTAATPTLKNGVTASPTHPRFPSRIGVHPTR